MKIFKERVKLSTEIRKNKGLSFIPTMGGLHKGHISLIKKSKKFKRKILVSIFVNPKQFNKKDDYRNYPRTLNKDIKILKKLKVHYLFIPSYEEVYGFKPKKKIYLDKTSNKLCGFFRKGHFKGVVDVVNRLIEIVKPKYIFFGKKDYQQLYLIKKHILKRKIILKVIECETIREKNGVALSTRNLKLMARENKIASNIYHYLKNIKKNKEDKFDSKMINKSKKNILKLGADKIDYLENYNFKKMVKEMNINKNTKLFIAYFIGKVRLIDNI